ncbi:hypothetical protein FIBSPDRAFT_936560 [Athelia psychrophila]|uniref:Uncharacterized protein n=1 Tax=Athelia psychrophila TaxID=1759441 RepID=A0A166BY14_9AGAM|nr:hypothetical protein FIBSPDRAFT_936560 [Fibularhizoctonia sp. CBS 109695]
MSPSPLNEAPSGASCGEIHLKARCEIVDEDPFASPSPSLCQNVAFAPVLLPSHASGSGGFSQWSKDEIADIEELSLTHAGFQLALIVDDNLRRQADTIFQFTPRVSIAGGSRGKGLGGFGFPTRVRGNPRKCMQCGA